VTVTKGDGWRGYISVMPHNQMRPLGAVRSERHEGALVLDMSAGVYRLIDKDGSWWFLDQEKVRAALNAKARY
jgi:hypothetical protein